MAAILLWAVTIFTQYFNLRLHGLMPPSRLNINQMLRLSIDPRLEYDGASILPYI